ncbi:MAG: lipoate--protein ligase [Clostridia bacterium]|nr:lipoate--protein ligase [Clostridia bacterium]
MTDRLVCCISGGLKPYYNQGLEKHLLTSVGESTNLLYLWQNDRTVVIGKNQCARQECNVEKLLSRGGFLARRLSGGGAVYHDKGNLNYTFISREENFDIQRNVRIVLNAVKAFGIRAEASGRNDLTADGKKFSGTAYYLTREGCMHHGTLLIDGDLELMGSYLNVPEEKLQKHAVASVRSRVVNLKTLCPKLSVEAISKGLIEAFCAEYGLDCEMISPPERVEEEGFFSDYSWIYGEDFVPSLSLKKRLSFGNVTLLLRSKDGIITDAAFHTDAMDDPPLRQAAKGLRGKRLMQPDMLTAFGQTPEEAEVSNWLKGEFTDV